MVRFQYSIQESQTWIKIIDLQLEYLKAPVDKLAEQYKLVASVVQSHKQLISNLAKYIQDDYLTKEGTYDNYIINLVVDAFLLRVRLENEIIRRTAR